MRGDPLGARELARDIQRAPVAKKKPQRMTAEDLERESPEEGADIAHARARADKRQVERLSAEAVAREDLDDDEAAQVDSTKEAS